jgi:hypothetical protein
VRQLRRHERCLNCGEPVATDFCGRCGQENTDYRVSIKRLGGDLAEELFQLESRLWRTLWTLLRRPGLLTTEYNAGRRVRWTTPLRLYLIASVAYFAVASLVPGDATIVASLDESDRQEMEQALRTESSPLKRRVRQHILELSKADPRAVGQRMRAALESQVPKAMALLVPAFALLSWLLFRRPRLFFVAHLVLALHVHALTFLLLLAAKVSRADVLSSLALFGAWLWMVLAMRRVFAASWWRASWKASVIGIAYSSLVGVVLMAISLASLWTE